MRCEVYLGGMELDDIAFDGMAWHWVALVICARHSSIACRPHWAVLHSMS